MRAIVVMFDSLNRRMLPAYGSDAAHAPNFARLAQHSATFDRCYAGSMPCMPARRELHTGRYNFLHRGWGPLEPFDDSVPELLSQAGVYTHLVTDHYHYWQDGGATYHNRFDSYELFRGQESDRWKGEVAAADGSGELKRLQALPVRHHRANRAHVADEATHPQTLTFDAGLEFVERNRSEDRWLVQIETFDPHEPFLSPERFLALYPHRYDGPRFDWPDYGAVTESDEQVMHMRSEYLALLSMCDASLGRVLDTMDRHDLWRDTLLIVCTDHGFMLGERGWWGKQVTPWYQETINTPLYEHTLMPTHMDTRFSAEELRDAELAGPFSFTKGVRPLRVPGHNDRINPYRFGTLLFDLEQDPAQRTPLIDDALELRMAQALVELMRAADAPADQYRRLGLPQTGPAGPEHLLVRRQLPQVQRSLRPAHRATDLEALGDG